MSKTQVISKFKGIAPALGANVAPGVALSAQNVDLSSGKIRPLKRHALISARAVSHNSMVYQAGESEPWLTGDNRHYLKWRLNDLDLLFYLDGGVLKKHVVGTTKTADVGQALPVKPTVESLTTIIDLAEEDDYRWKRSTHGDSEFYCVRPGGGNPQLSLPDRIKINDEFCPKKDLGSLTPWSWGYGNLDNLGFQTVYIRLPKTDDSDYKELGNLKQYLWHLSGSGTNEWYVTDEAGADPNLTSPAELLYGVSDHASGALIAASDWQTQTKCAKAPLGSLTEKTWNYGDNDSLGYSTVYFKAEGFINPSTMMPGKIKVAQGIMSENKPKSIKYYLNDGHLDSNRIYYVFTLTRNVGGHHDESGPSGRSTRYQADSERLRITRPTVNDPYVTHWNLYRLSSETGTYLFVHQIPISEGHYDDNLLDAELGIAIPTWYTSPQGQDIMFTKPTTLNGICAEIHSGMIFGWNGNMLYWSEPGYPDAWPYQYGVNFPATIKNVVLFAGTIVVLTSIGPFRIDGTNPELMQQSKVLGKEPCINEAAYPTARGVLYYSDSGIVLFNLVETTVITNGRFTEDWFKANISPTLAFLIENDGIFYLFNGNWALRGDTRFGGVDFIQLTFDGYVLAAYVRPDNGELYFLIEGAGIHQLHGSATDDTWIWRSGDLLLGSTSDKTWLPTVVSGSGAVGLILYVDGVEVAGKDLGWDMVRNRSLGLFDGISGRALQFTLSGTGTVDEVTVEGSIS